MQRRYSSLELASRGVVPLDLLGASELAQGSWFEPTGITTLKQSGRLSL